MITKRIYNYLRCQKLGYHFRNSHKLSCISEIRSERSEGSPASIKGWVKALRIQKKNVFIDVNDGSCVENLQVFLPREKKPLDLTWGSSVEIIGKLSVTPKGQLELVADDLTVIGSCDVTDGFPFNPRQVHPPEYVRQFMHFRPKTNYISSMLRVRHVASRAVHDYFNSLGYINIHVPILTSNDCEGAGEVFRVQPECEATMAAMLHEGCTLEEAYFNSKTFLTVSGQLHLEAAAHGLGKVYSFGPTFRAENSKSRLHLSEFYMVEAELAFINDLSEIENLIENLIKSVSNAVLDKCNSDILNLHGTECANFPWLNKPFKSITYEEAFELLQNNKGDFETPLVRGEAFAKEHELYLVKLMDNVPTFITDWPKRIKPFYMRDCANDPTKVAALDLLAPITGEIAGGSLRENNFQALKNKLPTPSLNWYLDLRKFGSVPTGGFGLGFERYLQLICGVPNIKDVIPFPRWPHNCPM